MNVIKRSCVFKVSFVSCQLNSATPKGQAAAIHVVSTSNPGMPVTQLNSVFVKVNTKKEKKKWSPAGYSSTGGINSSKH